MQSAILRFHNRRDTDRLNQAPERQIDLATAAKNHLEPTDQHHFYERSIQSVSTRWFNDRHKSVILPFHMSELTTLFTTEMPTTTHPPTPQKTLIATIGFHGSGSTWVFNIARELARHAADHTDPVSGYADAIADLPPHADNPTLWRVLKSHYGSAEMDAWLETAGARYLLTVRDPRDAALSMQQRFTLTLQSAVQIVVNDCRRIHALRTRPDHLLLRYETGFFRSPATILAIASWLGISLTPPEADAIAARYTPEATAAFAAAIATLPPDRIGARGAQGGTFDRLTNIHDVHIGDMRTGKWRDLPPDVQTEITRIFQPFLEAFDYQP
jgi:hypothetical protein